MVGQSETPNHVSDGGSFRRNRPWRLAGAANDPGQHARQRRAVARGRHAGSVGTVVVIVGTPAAPKDRPKWAQDRARHPAERPWCQRQVSAKSVA
jgi:hypothetical protein